MAEILSHKIEFLTNNPFGTYVAGDVIEVYVEKTLLAENATFSTTGVVTYLNGAVITSGAMISIQADVINVQKTFLSLCVGTDLLVTQIDTIFPYGYYNTLAGHYSCALVPATCDLAITGPASVIHASAEGVADGQITINATSTNTIQYSLDNITWQSSPTFTGLLKSTYRVYLKDTKNCQLNILVDVLISDDYGTIYRLEYDNTFNSSTTKLDITKRSYSGSVTEIKGGDNAFELQLRGESSDKFQALMSTQGNLNLTSETDQFFLELYTNDPNLYRLNYYKDTVLKWTGKILPFIYSEDYKSPPYYVTVTATDGLAELKGFYFLQKDGTRMYGTMKLIKIIAYCLEKLNFGFPIRVACNMYSTGMASTASDDPLDQAYVDLECFYIEQDGEEVSLDFVLKSILDSFGCRIVQWEGRWNIIRVEELNASYDWRQFDQYGDYVSNGTTDPVIDIEFPSQSAVMFAGTPSLELQPGFGTIRSDYSLGLKPNILTNGDFSIKYEFVKPPTRGDGGYQAVIDKRGWTLALKDYAIYESFEEQEDGNVAWVLADDDDILSSQEAGNAAILSAPYTVKMGVSNGLKISITYNISTATIVRLGRLDAKFPYIKVRLRVRYGSYYLTENGEWTTTSTTIDFFETKTDEWVTRDINAYPPTVGTPVDGMAFEVVLYHATPFYTRFKTLAALRALDTVTGTGYPDNVILPIGQQTELRDTFTADSDIYYYELEENDEAESGYDIVRPDDYDATDNPRAWVLKRQVRIYSVSVRARELFFKIDKVEVKYLTEGKDPVKILTETIVGEAQNKQVFDKKFIIGSKADVVTVKTYANRINRPESWRDEPVRGNVTPYVPVAAPVITIVYNILSSDLIYTGWLRNSSGVAYDLWTRDGQAESDKLHKIWLKTAVVQYNKSWRLLRAAIVSNNTLFSPINSYREVNESNRIYLPVNGSLNDFQNVFSLELAEIGVSGVAPSGREHSSAFSTAHS